MPKPYFAYAFHIIRQSREVNNIYNAVSLARTLSLRTVIYL